MLHPKRNIVLTFASDYDRFYMYKCVCFFTDMLSLQQNISSVIKANRRLYGAGIFLSFFQMTSRMVSIFLRCSAPVVMMYIRVVLMFEWPKRSASFATSWSML